MLDPAYVRDHQEEVKRGLQSRGMNADGELRMKPQNLLLNLPLASIS